MLFFPLSLSLSLSPSSFLRMALSSWNPENGGEGVRGGGGGREGRSGNLRGPPMSSNMCVWRGGGGGGAVGVSKLASCGESKSGLILAPLLNRVWQSMFRSWRHENLIKFNTTRGSFCPPSCMADLWG